MNLLRTALCLAVVALVATGAWTQNECEENVGTGPACATIVSLINAGFAGGFDLRGTQYENTCAKGNGCTVDMPQLRFWEYDTFLDVNSGDASRLPGPDLEWMSNENLDFGTSGLPTGVWVINQANWAVSGTEGCPAAPPAQQPQVAELSFCDTNGNAYYGISSVADPLGINFYDFDGVTGASGVDGNIVEASIVPSAVVTDAVQLPPLDPTDCEMTFDIPAAPYFTENGLNDPARPLIAGIELLEQTVDPTAPPATCIPGLGAWNVLGVYQPGSTDNVVTVPLAIAPTEVHLAARVVYSDVAASCTSADCSAPADGYPASCFASFIVEPRCTDTPVNFGSFDAKRTGGNDVQLTWTTTMETDTWGFKVLRRAAGSSDYVQVGGIVMAMGTGSRYTTTDSSALRSLDYDYKILEVALAGNPSVAGPVRVEGLSAHGKRTRILKRE